MDGGPYPASRLQWPLPVGVPVGSAGVVSHGQTVFMIVSFVVIVTSGRVPMLVVSGSCGRWDHASDEVQTGVELAEAPPELELEDSDVLKDV